MNSDQKISLNSVKRSYEYDMINVLGKNRRESYNASESTCLIIEDERNLSRFVELN